jgi:hypothetical protein
MGANRERPKGEVTGSLARKPRASSEVERLKRGRSETQPQLQRVGAKGRFMTDDAR